MQQPFRIYYLNNMNSATSLSHFLYPTFTRIKHELKIPSEAPITIYLCASEQQYNALTSNALPEWSAGAAIPSQRTIVLKTYQPYPELHTTAVHELVHIMVHSIINKPIPRWFDEGLAVYYSDDKVLASRSLVSKALLSNSIIALSDIDRVLSFDQTKAHLAYQESYLTILFLVDKYGIEKLNQLIYAINDAPTLDDAFQQTLGIDLWDFELAWFKYIQKRHRWNFLADIDNYLWIIILGIFLVGFISIRFRNWKTIKRWEQEEENELW
ncbi:hypothetical protein JW960_13610 [candidate division KSB1 bacterium]|nr:hypothetical protein [candidate division KSB1 bacterium]